MVNLEDQRKFENFIHKAKIIRITYWIGAVLAFLILIPGGTYIGQSLSDSLRAGYDGGSTGWALAMLISITSWFLGNRQIRKYRAESAMLLAEISRREAYIPDNRLELATPFARPPPEPSHPYPQPETIQKYCGVCNREILPSDMVYNCLKCNYSAHQIHLAEWFRTHKECPNCLG